MHRRLGWIKCCLLITQAVTARRAWPYFRCTPTCCLLRAILDFEPSGVVVQRISIGGTAGLPRRNVAYHPSAANVESCLQSNFKCIDAVSTTSSCDESPKSKLLRIAKAGFFTGQIPSTQLCRSTIGPVLLVHVISVVNCGSLWNGQVRSKEEDFLDLSVEVEQNTSITHCLQAFSNTETLCSECKYYCEVCCSKQEAQKRWASWTFKQYCM